MDSGILVFFLICLQIQNVVVISQEIKYNFNPESRNIEVTEGGDYWIGFDDSSDPQFDHCYYESDSISGDYSISHSEWNVTTTLPDGREIARPWDLAASSSNELSPLSLQCGFHFSYADDKSPSKWKITARDRNGKNYTETVTVSFFYKIPALLDSIALIQSTNFFNFLKPNNQVKLNQCFLKVNNTTIELLMDQKKTNISNDDDLASRLDGLGEGKCGFMLRNVAKNDPSEFLLIAADSQNRSYKQLLKAVFLPSGVNPEYTRNRTVEAYIGDSASILCGTDFQTSSASYQKFCHLYNPKGQLVSSEIFCYYTLPIVTREDIGRWACEIGYEFSMDALIFETQLIEKKTESVQSWSEDKGSYHVIGCKLSSATSASLNFCKFLRPDGKVFLVKTGRATDRYSTVSTDLDNQICSLEISKPLTNEDKGNWKCEANGVFGSNGAYVTVHKSNEVSYSKSNKLTAHLGDSAFTIKCSVPYSSPFCYVRSPNGTLYRPTGSNYYRANLGDCVVDFGEVKAVHNGIWSCFFGRDNGLPDEEINVELSIIEIKVIYADATVSEGENAELICNTGGMPLEYCRFVSPSGLSYYLTKGNTISQNKISYFGRGLEYGDCGVNISNAVKQDQGQWTCHISVGRITNSKKRDASARMQLDVNSSAGVTTLAGSIGIAVGILAVVAVGGAFAVYRWRSSRSRNRDRSSSPNAAQQTNTGNRESNNSNDSRDRILLQQSHGVFYTTGGNTDAEL